MWQKNFIGTQTRPNFIQICPSPARLRLDLSSPNPPVSLFACLLVFHSVARHITSPPLQLVGSRSAMSLRLHRKMHHSSSNLTICQPFRNHSQGIPKTSHPAIHSLCRRPCCCMLRSRSTNKEAYNEQE